MTKLVVVAEGNMASRNIGKVLLEKYPRLEKNVFRIKENVLDLDKYEHKFEKLKPEVIIVASSHKSEKGVDSLSCHAPGNWGSADLGGSEKKLSKAPAIYLREALLELKKQQETLGLGSYEVTLEVTHHSPTFDLPILFVEVGSGERQWRDMRACEAVANVIHKLITAKLGKVPVGVGFGGGHYAPTFTRRVLEEKIAFGHICPQYAFSALTEELVLQAMKKNIPDSDFAVIEWKGLKSPQRQFLIDIFEKHEIKWVRDKELKSS